jgi:AcrR family transcriptional regulator
MAKASVPRRTSHLERKRARRRQEIIHAALDAVRERGYHATTLDDIAARLGVRKTALYHYFPDKDAILLECHRESLTELGRIVERARTVEGVEERLRFLIREHIRIMTETLEGSPLAFEVSALAREARSEVIGGRDRFEAVLRALVAEGIRDGVFRPVDPKIVVFGMLGAINWIARWYRPEGELHALELGETFADYLLNGLMMR